MRSARAVSISSPENSRCFAVAGPVSATRRRVDDAAYTMPSLAGVTPKDAPSSANRRSQAAANWLPPPTQYPRITASVGRGNAASASSAATASACGSPSGSRSEEMSAPAQKVSPAPVSTSTRTPGSAASRSSSPGSSPHIAAVIALRLAGLLITTVATPSATVCSSPGSVRSMCRMLSVRFEPMIKKGSGTRYAP